MSTVLGFGEALNALLSFLLLCDLKKLFSEHQETPLAGQRISSLQTLPEKDFWEEAPAQLPLLDSLES